MRIPNPITIETKVKGDTSAYVSWELVDAKTGEHAGEMGLSVNVVDGKGGEYTVTATLAEVKKTSTPTIIDCVALFVLLVPIIIVGIKFGKMSDE